MTVTVAAGQRSQFHREGVAARLAHAQASTAQHQVGRLVGDRLVGEGQRSDTRSVLYRVARRRRVAQRHGVRVGDRRRQGQRHGPAGDRHARRRRARAAVHLHHIRARRRGRTRVEVLVIGQDQGRPVRYGAQQTRRQVRAHRHLLVLDPGWVDAEGDEVPLFLTDGRGDGIRADRELRTAQVQDRAVGQLAAGYSKSQAVCIDCVSGCFQRTVNASNGVRRRPVGDRGRVEVAETGTGVKAESLNVDTCEPTGLVPHRQRRFPVVARGTAVAGRRHYRPHRVADDRLGIARAVGEAHVHPDRAPHVRGRHRVGAARADSRRHIRGVHAHPHEGVAGREGAGRQTVRVVDGALLRRQLLAHLRRAGNLRLAHRVGGGGASGQLQLNRASPVVQLRPELSHFRFLASFVSASSKAKVSEPT